MRPITASAAEMLSPFRILSSLRASRKNVNVVYPAGSAVKPNIAWHDAVWSCNGWPLRVIEDCADDPPRDQPEAFLEALRE